MRKKAFVSVIAALFALAVLTPVLRAQEVLAGTWKTVADEGEDKGKAKSHLEIFEKDGAYFARIAKLLLEPQDKVCEKCKGDLKGKPLVGIEERAVKAMQQYSWPGNIREMQNVIERAAVLTHDKIIKLGNLPLVFAENYAEGAADVPDLRQEDRRHGRPHPGIERRRP